jgi:hypothetical protein
MEYTSHGIYPRLISLQPESDCSTPSHDACLFSPGETSKFSGYFNALDMIYDLLHREMANVPGMIGPEPFRFHCYTEKSSASNPRI